MPIRLSRPEHRLLKYFTQNPDPDLSPDNLAAVIKASTSTVSRTLSILRARGFITTKTEGPRILVGVTVNPGLDLSDVYVSYRPRGYYAEGKQ